MGYTYTFTILLDPDEEDGGYTVTVPALPGCITEGDSREEALANAHEAIALHVETLLADGLEVPLECVAPELARVTVRA